MYPPIQKITTKWNGEERVTYFFKEFEDKDDKIKEAVRDLFYCIADEVGHYNAEKQRVYFYVKKEDALDDCYEDERWDTYNMLCGFQFWKSDWNMFRTCVKEETIMRYLHQHLSDFITVEEVEIDSIGDDTNRLKMEFDKERERRYWDNKIETFEIIEAQDKTWGEERWQRR